MSKEIRLVYAHLQDRKGDLEATLLRVNEQVVQADLRCDRTMRDVMLASRAHVDTSLREVQNAMDFVAHFIIPDL